MSKKYQIVPVKGGFMVRELRKPYGNSKQQNLTGVWVKGSFSRTHADAERWIEAHGGWYGESEEHSNAAHLGHLRRRGY